MRCIADQIISHDSDNIGSDSNYGNDHVGENNIGDNNDSDCNRNLIRLLQSTATDLAPPCFGVHTPNTYFGRRVNCQFANCGIRAVAGQSVNGRSSSAVCILRTQFVNCWSQSAVCILRTQYANRVGNQTAFNRGLLSSAGELS